MNLRQYIPRVILSPLVFSAATFGSVAMFLFPWWLVVGMHSIMLLYELFRLPFTLLGIKTPQGDEPLFQVFESNLANNLLGVFMPLLAPFYITYIFITEGKAVL